MKTKIIKDKLIPSFKILICTFTLLIISSSAYAEYYIVVPSCGGGCRVGCVPHKPPCKRVSSRRHCGRPCYYPRVVSPVAFYYVQPVSSNCWCGETWVPGHCGPCAQWVSGSWQPSNYDVYYRQPRYINDRIYDPDLATGDDDADIHPDMQINY